MRKLLVLLTIILILGATWVGLSTPTPAAYDSKVGVSRTGCGNAAYITSSGSACYISGYDLYSIAQTNPSTPGILGPLAGTTFVSLIGGTVAIVGGTVAISNIAAGTVAVSVLQGTTFIDNKFISGTNPAYFATANGASVSWVGSQGTTGTTVKAAAGAIKFISCDNSQNSEVSFLSFYDGLAPLIGSTTPTFQLTCASGTTAGAVVGKGPTNFAVGEDGGIKFATGLIVAASSNTSTVLNPTNKIGLTIIYK